MLGLEPKTYGLKGRCSTTELHPRNAVLHYNSIVRTVRASSVIEILTLRASVAKHSNKRASKLRFTDLVALGGP